MAMTNKTKSAFTYAEALIALLVCGMIAYLSMDFAMTIVQDKKDLMTVKNFNKNDAIGRSKELHAFATEQYNSQFRIKNTTGSIDFTVPIKTTQKITFSKKDYYECKTNTTNTTYNIQDATSETKNLLDANNESVILESDIAEDSYPRFEGLTDALKADLNEFTPAYYCTKQTTPTDLHTFNISEDTTQDRNFKLVFYDAKVGSD